MSVRYILQVKQSKSSEKQNVPEKIKKFKKGIKYSEKHPIYNTSKEHKVSFTIRKGSWQSVRLAGTITTKQK